MPPNGQNQGLTDPHFGGENQGPWRGQNAGFGSKKVHICPKSTFSARELGLGPEEGFCPLVYAVLDSGATHPMRQAKDEKEWEEALEVQVALAGDNTTSMRLTSSGTLLLPPGRDGLCQPIIPMGAIIEQLGYKLVWSAGSCELYPPGGSPLRLEVENGCPEVECNMALALIAQLEACKAQHVTPRSPASTAPGFSRPMFISVGHGWSRFRWVSGWCWLPRGREGIKRGSPNSPEQFGHECPKWGLPIQSTRHDYVQLNRGSEPG